MLEIVVPGSEYYDEEKEEFVTTKSCLLRLEHSLISLSKWESKWKKPFIGKEKTNEEIIDYIRCMTLTNNVNPLVYQSLTEQNLKDINDYIDDPHTATWFSDKDKQHGINREVITSEIIYYWMTAFQIPCEYQKWHLNRLLTLINVCSIKSQPPKKMSRKDAINNNRALNAARRQKLHSRG